MWTRPLWPLQLGVKRVQDVELHGFKEAVTLVFKYNRHHHLTAILQVALDVVHLVEGGRRKSLFFIIKYIYLHQEIRRGIHSKHSKSDACTQHQSTHHCFQETSLSTSRKSQEQESFLEMDATVLQRD